MQIPFGKFKGQPMNNLPEDYLMWLSKPKYSGKYYESEHSTELKWKVPLNVKLEARAILESRGYTLIGEHWE